MGQYAKLIKWTSAIIISLILIPVFLGVQTIQGNEIGVIQDWQQGVMDKTLRSGTHFYNNLAKDVHVFPIGTQKSTFGPMAGIQGEYPPIDVVVGEQGGQSAKVLISVNYHLDPSKFVTLYRQGLAESYEQVVLNREIIDTVNQVARPRVAAENIYSGVGFNSFKMEVDDALKNNEVLEGRGIIVENTIISDVWLDPKYKEQIDLKQIAKQSKLRAIEEALAADEEAKKVKSEMQSVVEKRTQEAIAKKAEQVLAAQAEGESLEAIAKGQRAANEAKAVGDLALGRAEAEVSKLKSDALYSGESGARRAQVEIATQQAKAASTIANKLAVVPQTTFMQLGDMMGVAKVNDKEFIERTTR